MATTKIVLTNTPQKVSNAACFISYLGIGIELGFGSTDTSTDAPTIFHQIVSPTFEYRGALPVWIRLPEGLPGRKVTATITTG